MSAQSLSALANANRIRLARAQVKREIREGVRTVPDCLGLDCCRSMRVFDLLQAQRSWGSSGPRRSAGVKTVRLLSAVGVGPYRVVAELTDRQRRVLVEQLKQAA